MTATGLRRKGQGLEKARRGLYALEDVRLARLRLESDEMALELAVRGARREDWSWEAIAEELNCSAESARERYKKRGVR